MKASTSERASWQLQPSGQDREALEPHTYDYFCRRSRPRSAGDRAVSRVDEAMSHQRDYHPEVVDRSQRPTTWYGWPKDAHTMLSLKRLDNIQYCVERALHDGVPGDLIEAGVWRGGATIFMRAVLKPTASSTAAFWNRLVPWSSTTEARRSGGRGQRPASLS